MRQNILEITVFLVSKILLRPESDVLTPVNIESRFNRLHLDYVFENVCIMAESFKC